MSMQFFDFCRMRNCIVVATAIAVQLSCSGSAFAHHPTGGKLPATLTDGLLSGIGHPVIGLDHLVFIVGIGLLAAVSGAGALLPVMFVVAMSAGLALHIGGVGLPGVELAIATSVALVGLSLLRSRLGERKWLEAGAFGAAGVFHGYALAESIIGAEPTPIVAYVVGLVACQSVIALGAYFAAHAAGAAAVGERPVVAKPVRVAGAAILSFGAVLVAQASGLAA